MLLVQSEGMVITKTQALNLDPGTAVTMTTNWVTENSRNLLPHCPGNQLYIHIISILPFSQTILSKPQTPFLSDVPQIQEHTSISGP